MKLAVSAALAGVVAGLLAACQPAGQLNEQAAKDLFARCGAQQVLSACDDLVALPGLADTDRANTYATRARVLANRGRTEDAIHDLNAALKLDPGNREFLLFKIALAGSIP
jgi:hypothetical protein